jgi:beta-glucanase (GH16 family)
MFIIYGLEYNFPSRISENLGFSESIVKFIGQGARVLGSKYQTWSKTYQTLPKASNYYLEFTLKV